MPSQKSLELIAGPRGSGNKGEHIGAPRIPMDYPFCSRQPLPQKGLTPHLTAKLDLS